MKNENLKWYMLFLLKHVDNNKFNTKQIQLILTKTQRYQLE
jgi:hypothetical protein